MRSAIPTSLLALSLCFAGNSPASAECDSSESILIHPPYTAETVSREHPAGHERALGDRLGRDFMVVALAGSERPWPHSYRGDGTENEHWYGWHEAVLAPIDGLVEAVHVNPETNRPGHFGEPPASSIRLRRDDGTRVMIAHVRDISVEEDQSVTAGEPVAYTGNDGHSFAPHVHIGAWRGSCPLQIQVDLEILGRELEPFVP